MQPSPSEQALCRMLAHRQSALGLCQALPSSSRLSSLMSGLSCMRKAYLLRRWLVDGSHGALV